MITSDAFRKARHFVYRHGDLLTRKRFSFHFEDGSKESVVDVLACYQNPDGGFGNGLELDVLCPDSSGICTEVALAYLVEFDACHGPVFEQGLNWVLDSAAPNGDLPHPVDAVTRYPHGEWWAKKDSGRIMSIAGLLGKVGKGHPEVCARAAAVFEKTCLPFPEELDVYSYPVNLYLRYADGADKYAEFRGTLRARFATMLEKAAWHHPLFFCHDRWASDDIPLSLWRQEAERAAATLQDDGGVQIEQYSKLPWWRPVWTLDMLVTMKNRGLFTACC